MRKRIGGGWTAIVCSLPVKRTWRSEIRTPEDAWAAPIAARSSSRSSAHAWFANCGSEPICTLHRRDLGGAMQLYTGRLCQRCNYGYYPWFGKCLECPDSFGWAPSNVGTVHPPSRVLSPPSSTPFRIHGRVSALGDLSIRDHLVVMDPREPILVRGAPDGGCLPELRPDSG